MAVFFPTQVGQILRPDRSDQLLQGFLNLQTSEGAQGGVLTQANLVSYSQKRFLVADPNADVASYLLNNFATIAALDGNASSISANDLVQIRSGLPPVQQQPPVTQPPVTQPPIQNIFFALMQMMMHMLSSLFGRF